MVAQTKLEPPIFDPYDIFQQQHILWAPMLGELGSHGTSSFPQDCIQFGAEIYASNSPNMMNGTLQQPRTMTHEKALSTRPSSVSHMAPPPMRLAKLCGMPLGYHAGRTLVLTQHSPLLPRSARFLCPQTTSRIKMPPVSAPPQREPLGFAAQIINGKCVAAQPLPEQSIYVPQIQGRYMPTPPVPCSIAFAQCAPRPPIPMLSASVFSAQGQGIVPQSCASLRPCATLPSLSLHQPQFSQLIQPP